MPSFTIVGKLITVFCAFASLSQAAFTPPKEHENGIYIYNSASKSHTKLDVPLVHNSTSEIQTLAKGAKFPRKPKINTDAVCGNIIIASLDYDSALNQFNTACNAQTAKIPAGHHIYSKYGDAMIFMCNYHANECKINDAKDFFGYVNKQCGSTVVGNPTGYVRKEKGLSYGLASAQDHAC